MSGMLHIVSTPVGNLDDITRRALAVLAEVDAVAAEDTRHTGRLLDELGIRQSLISYHDHNEQERTPQLIERLLRGDNLALVSDAGTPLVSDPGYRLVRACHQAGIRVVPVPGASALLAALVVAGLPTDRFIFEGFLPSKGSGRNAALRRISESAVTSVVYEAPHRILTLLDELKESVEADREVVLCRELTKHFETVLVGSVGDIRDKVAADSNQQRGEIVLLVAPAPERTVDDAELARLARLLLAELPASRAAKVLAAWSGKKKSELYGWLETLAD
ncbi:16S rRNA (cytidine(1402)-2'-O)-methyltransferase [Alcanivorax sp. 1008]|uniref:16S rRNA (cytidine(1402)-2'-O)-methyltransferase n=1 Tax=Alcanivorax sp. 1008 TaxID=2816853 RepID=UPI001D9E11FB|nr:16S rRNA (cytidine(1402)-2'-O)-methyltransferase [Alcanivorax sp. 1008]MCC1495261.1 16S rRNA (cytidine(1402)-2'-O)-methyltransferase [Alcanivorax sp. 1008]